MAGLTKAGSQTRGDANTSQVGHAGPLTQMEQDLRNQYASLNEEQIGQMRNVMGQYGGLLSSRGASGSFALDPQEMEQLNQAYAGSEANLRRFGQIMGQDLAGTRGLNTSDTPVSEAVLRETMPAMAALQGQKMQYGLGLGLQARNSAFGNKLAGLQGLTGAATTSPTTGFNLMNSLQADRMANKSTFNNQNTSMGMPWINRLLTVTEGFKNIGQGIGGMQGASDERLKRDITPVSWKWNVGEGEEYLGVVAQDLQRSHPHLVSRHPDGHLQVDYGAMVAMLLNERTHLYAQLEARG